jgi:iron complex outermembrane receptor protein
MTANTYLANFTAEINDNVTLRLGYIYNNVTRSMIWGNNYFTVDPDIFRLAINAVKFRFKSQGGQGYVDFNFNTGSLAHKLVVGANYSARDHFQKTASAPFTYAGRFSDPSIANNYDLRQYDLMGRIGDFTTGNRAAKIQSKNFIIGDSVQYGEKWEFMLGANYSELENNSYTMATGKLTSSFNGHALTPTFAVLFKPIINFTVYASYIQGLESGSTVGTGFANEGEILPPYISEQYEFGAKALLGRMFFTAALYHLDRPSSFTTADNYLTQDGNQRSRGFEFTFRGKVVDDLTLLGGFNIAEAIITKSSNPRIQGKSAKHAPKFTGKIFFEYDTPFLEGLTLTGGVNYFGKVYSDDYNQTVVPAYAYGDLGFRYTYKFADDKKMSFRLNVSNVTNESYWYGGGASHLQVGLPRTIAFTADIEY